MRHPRERLNDILEAIAAIEKYLPQDKQAFERNELLQSWFVRHLQIIGEAARTIPEPVRQQAAGIPWQEISGMRNVLVHGYFEIDTDVVWDTANTNLAALKLNIEHLLAHWEDAHDAL